MANEFQNLKDGLLGVIQDSKERPYSEIVILATVVIVLIKHGDKTNVPEFDDIHKSTEPFDEFILTKITGKKINVNTIDFDTVTEFFELAQMFYQTMFDVKTEDTEVKDTITKIKDEFKERTNPLITQIYLGHLKSSIVPAAVSSEIKKKIDARCKTVKYLEQVEMQEFKEIPDLKQNIITKIGMKEQLCIILVDAEKYSEEILEAVPFQYFYLVIYGKEALEIFCNPLGTVLSNSTSTEFVNKIKELQGINEKLLDVYILDESITVTPSVTPPAVTPTVVEVIHYLPNAYSKYTIKFNATDQRIMLQDDNAKEYIILELMHLFLTDNGGVKKAKEEAKKALVEKEEAVKKALQDADTLSTMFVDQFIIEYYSEKETMPYNAIFKLGQILRLSPDLVTKAFINAFFKSQDSIVKKIDKEINEIDENLKNITVTFSTDKNYRYLDFLLELLNFKELTLTTSLAGVSAALSTSTSSQPTLTLQQVVGTNIKGLIDAFFAKLGEDSNKDAAINIFNALIETLVASAHHSLKYAAIEKTELDKMITDTAGMSTTYTIPTKLKDVITEFKKPNGQLCLIDISNTAICSENDKEQFDYKKVFLIIRDVLNANETNNPILKFVDTLLNKSISHLTEKYKDLSAPIP